MRRPYIDGSAKIVHGFNRGGGTNIRTAPLSTLRNADTGRIRKTTPYIQRTISPDKLTRVGGFNFLKIEGLKQADYQVIARLLDNWRREVLEFIRSTENCGREWNRSRRLSPACRVIFRAVESIIPGQDRVSERLYYNRILIWANTRPFV